MTLFQYKTESDKLRTEAAKLKTKKAKLKRYDMAREIECSAGPLMRELFPIGQVLTVERSINCTTPGGGGWGLNKGAQVEVIEVYSNLVVVDCNNTVMYLYMLGYESRGWCSNNIFAFTEYLATKGQSDIQLAEAEENHKSSSKSLAGAYRCRNAKGLKESESFKARLKQQIEWTRKAKLKVFKLQVESITHADVAAFRKSKAGA